MPRDRTFHFNRACAQLAMQLIKTSDVFDKIFVADFRCGHR